eukprot:24386-Prymnesium_polylepis.1
MQVWARQVTDLTWEDPNEGGQWPRRSTMDAKMSTAYVNANAVDVADVLKLVEEVLGESVNGDESLEEAGLDSVMAGDLCATASQSSASRSCRAI